MANVFIRWDKVQFGDQYVSDRIVVSRKSRGIHNERFYDQIKTNSNRFDLNLIRFEFARLVELKSVLNL